MIVALDMDASRDDQEPRSFDQQHELLAIAEALDHERWAREQLAELARLEYEACQKAVAAAAQAGGSSLGAYAMAAGTAHKFYRLLRAIAP